MSIEIQLSITKLTKKSLVDEFSDVVKQVDYYAVAKSVEYPSVTETCAGTIQLNIDELNDSEFINFEDVDEDLVISWLLSNQNVNEIEELSFIKFLLYQIKIKIEKLQEEEEILKAWKVDKVLNVSIDEIQNPLISNNVVLPIESSIASPVTESVDSEPVITAPEDPVVMPEVYSEAVYMDTI